jgi:hypothetical protein
MAGGSLRGVARDITYSVESHLALAERKKILRAFHGLAEAAE